MCELEATRTRTTVEHSRVPAVPGGADGRGEDVLRLRIRRLLASGALHRRPWRLSTRPASWREGPQPCVICFDPADTTYAEAASRFAAAAHAEPCERLWIEEALEADE